MKLFVSFILLITMFHMSFSQCNGRYESEIFNSINTSFVKPELFIVEDNNITVKVIILTNFIIN